MCKQNIVQPLKVTIKSFNQNGQRYIQYHTVYIYARTYVRNNTIQYKGTNYQLVPRASRSHPVQVNDVFNVGKFMATMLHTIFYLIKNSTPLSSHDDDPYQNAQPQSALQIHTRSIIFLYIDGFFFVVLSLYPCSMFKKYTEKPQNIRYKKNVTLLRQEL